MDDLRDDEMIDEFGVVPVVNLAWQMFTQTGAPGLYMLYRDLRRGEDRSILD